MEEISDSTTPSRPPSESKHHNPSSSSTTSRLWRPAAQRNLRNQWSKLASCKQQWSSLSSSGRSQATSLVNSYLSQSYMNAMELGALRDMPDIRKKASWKLFKQQELYRSKLLSTYKDMVAIVVNMVNISRSMRSFLKGTNSPLVQFTNLSEDTSDTGDGGGIPVFVFSSISSFEELAQELVQMFALELILKRLLVVELQSISWKEFPIKGLHWPDELYRGEFDDLVACGVYSKEYNEPTHPKMKVYKSSFSAQQLNRQPDHQVLQVYLTAWLAEVNIDSHRVDEIFTLVGEEMHVSFS